MLTAAAAISLAGRRDLGAAVIARTAPRPASTRLLSSSGAMAIRLERWPALAWIAGIFALALMFGVVARSAAAGNVAVSAIEQQLGRLGARPGSAVAAWIGYEFLFLAALVAFAAAGQMSSLRSEETDGPLDNLLARPLGRAAWLAGRLGVAVALVLAAGLAAGIGGWIGIAARHGRYQPPACTGRQ